MLSQIKKIVSVGVALLIMVPAFAYGAQSAQSQFINQLVPTIHLANSHVAQERERLQKDYNKWSNGEVLSKREWGRVKKLAKKYKLEKCNFYNKTDWQKLLARVDVVPAPLVLAQAINESGWGRSRFAKQGNNFFGVWCYSKGCGIVPLKRPANRTYEVRRYPSKLASIEDYLLNLNTNHAYQQLRAIRLRQHRNGQSLNALKLAQGLSHYSERRGAYVQSIKGIINRYNLKQFS